MCRAIRDWSIAHPGDFALLFGSPVPGYAAPRETVAPATRTTLALVRVVADAVGSGAPGASGASGGSGTSGSPVTSTPGTAGRPGSPTAPTAAPGVAGPAVADGVATLRSFGITLPDEVLVRTLMAWTTVFGDDLVRALRALRGVRVRRCGVLRPGHRTPGRRPGVHRRLLRRRVPRSGEQPDRLPTRAVDRSSRPGRARRPKRTNGTVAPGQLPDGTTLGRALRPGPADQEACL
ncbi:TetR-like C-terminal domain-containing protein [Curtobacterium flaccumfaciens]|nr:TetR-like C-terminal domain-containing protein [Curtobacterium flaccumfaciens]